MSKQTAEQLCLKLNREQREVLREFLDALSEKDLNRMIQTTARMTQQDLKIFSKIITAMHE